MEPITLFPLEHFWHLYLLFTAFVLGMLFLDLGVFHRKAHKVSFKEAATWSVVWVSLALLFNYALYHYSLHLFQTDPYYTSISGFNALEAARKVSLEFLTGYVVEKSLAVDNIFVFIVVFAYFHVPLIYQHRILFFGILGALLFRVIFISLGSVLMQYQAVILFFGIFLIFTGIKMFFAGEEKVEPEKNILIRLLKKVIPIYPKIEGQNFFVKHQGKWMATPLLVCLVFLEFSDIIFAVDSVPAIFALTRETFIVFTSNIFAVLGLRAMFFLLAGVMDKFHLLKIGLAFVLIFVGLKMVWLNKLFGGHFPITWSLGIIGGAILLSVLLSLLFPKKQENQA